MALYLVTGGCGFIGSHLCDALLAAGHGVRIIDNLSSGKRENAPAAAEIHIGDINDRALLEKACKGVDGIFHLAAVASVELSNIDWTGTHASNLTGTINIFDVARQINVSPIPVVYASSAAVYGSNQNVPLKESEEKEPLTAYGADKLGCELHARVAWNVHKVPNAGFRFFNVYGPRQDPNSPYSGVISIFAGRISRGEPIAIHGDGKQSRDFIYVGDIVRVLQAAMHNMRDGNEAYNVCTGKATNILELVEVIERINGKSVEKSHTEARIGDIRHSIGNPDAYQKRYGIAPEMSLEDGLRKTL